MRRCVVKICLETLIIARRKNVVATRAQVPITFQELCLVVRQARRIDRELLIDGCERGKEILFLLGAQKADFDKRVENLHGDKRGSGDTRKGQCAKTFAIFK